MSGVICRTKCLTMKNFPQWNYGKATQTPEEKTEKDIHPKCSFEIIVFVWWANRWSSFSFLNPSVNSTFSVIDKYYFENKAKIISEFKGIKPDSLIKISRYDRLCLPLCPLCIDWPSKSHPTELSQSAPEAVVMTE